MFKTQILPFSTFRPRPYYKLIHRLGPMLILFLVKYIIANYNFNGHLDLITYPIPLGLVIIDFHLMELFVQNNNWK